MICGAPSCGQEIRFDAGAPPDGARTQVLAPRSRTTPRAVSVQELWTCQGSACRTWAALRTEELEGGSAWLEHMKQVVLTRYCPELPEHVHQARNTRPRELVSAVTTANDRRSDAAGSPA